MSLQAPNRVSSPTPAFPARSGEQPSGHSSRAQRMLAPASVIGGLAVATLALRLRDPHQSGSWGLCPSAQIGIWCPGCGGLRAVNDLTHLDLAGAASSNIALLVAMPIVVVLLGRWALDAWTGRVRPAGSVHTTLVIALVLGALATFTVLRNLPGFTWLAP